MTATPPSNAQSKQGIFSSRPGSTRRPSISSLAGGYSPSLSQGIGYSPSTPVSSSTSSGIPSFRSLRSLLPFGPNKNATPVSISVSPNSSRSPFASFGSVRRSITKERERKVSLSNDAIVPVIAIERSNNDPFPDDTAIRRSVSLSTLDKPLPSEPSFEDSSSPSKGDLLPSAFTLRTPSPGPPLSAELSTIIEADNSGASKQIITNTSPTRTKLAQQHDALDSPSPECDVDASALDLSTTHLADQVRDAIREGDSLKRQWLNPDEAVIIIDGDEHPEVADATFNMDTVDRDLAALLSPHSVTTSASLQTSSVVTDKNSHSPATPHSPASPISRLPRARQASSFLPRLRPSNSPSITAPQFPVQAPSPTTPKASPSTVVNGNDNTAPNSPPPSPALPSASTSTPTPSRRSLNLNHTTRLFTPSASSSFSTPKAAKMFAKQYLNNNSATPNIATRALRQVLPSVRTSDSAASPSPSRPTLSLGRTSLDSRCASVTDIGLGRPSLEIRRGSFDSRTRPRSNRASTSPDRTETATTEAGSSPSLDMNHEEYRPSFDSNTTTRPSFDSISRPDSAARLRDWDRQRATPSLRVVDTTVRDRASPVPKITNPLARMRKRSMSVQERFGRGRVPANDIGPAVFSRPGSSLSGYSGKTSRGNGALLGLETGGSGNESGSPLGPKMEWLGPRTAKAFRAAGLLDFEREKEREREEGGEPTERLRDRSGSTSGVLSPSPLGIGNPGSTLNRFASLRSASEYNPLYGRSHSRLAMSETGTGGSGVPGRRGSESFSAYGASSYGGNGGGGGGGGGGGSSYGHSGLMESPTFTVSSGSRERDTPKSSTSTVPTSLADSFGYLGRDRSERDLNRERERDREREELREMKEKHGIEMGALLGALSDSQRTVRVLREENSDLRDRLERLTLAVQTTEELRQAYGDLENECSNLRRENTDLRRELRALKSTTSPTNSSLSYSWSAGNSSGMRTPVPKTATSSPLARTFTPRAAQEYDDTFIDHGSEVENHPHLSSTNDTEYTHNEHGTGSSEIILPPSSLLSSQKRRLSDSSSIFPTPPSNMTLLLHEDATSTLGSIGGCRNSADHSQYTFTLPLPPAAAAATATTSSSNSSQRKTHVRSLSQSPPISYRNFTGNIPNTTVGSISPTTANFSMVTGSPGSLFLRPEHEILLGDMESLDLGIQCGDGEVTNGKVDGW